VKSLIENYRFQTGEHCGSQSMRDLLRFYCRLDLPEEIVFGLGSGVDCIFLRAEQFNPALVQFGRTVTLETDLADALGVDYRESIEMDDEKAWELVRQEVKEGRPTMLSGDVFYLDYRKFKVHFPSHRFVLVGFDDERKVALIADRIAPEVQEASYGAVIKARNPPEGMSTYNLWGKFHGTTVGRSIEEACAVALRRNADRMLGRDTSQFDLLSALSAGADLDVATGLQGLATFSGDLAAWHERKDAAFLASYASQAIEKFGTGGGNFRKMYSGFLRWARKTQPDLVAEGAPALAERSAAAWTALSATLWKASEEPADTILWNRAAEQAREIHGIETELFETLGSVNAGA